MPDLLNQQPINPNDGWFTEAIDTVLDLQEDCAQSSNGTFHHVHSSTETQVSESDTETDVFEEQKEDPIVNVLELFPEENVVDDIQTVFRYIKQLGTGTVCNAS